MNGWMLLTSIALAMGFSASARADGSKASEKGVEVPPHAVTAPAWDTITDQAKHGRIDKIVLETEDGQPVYEATVVTFEGDTYEVEVDIDGKLIEKELEGHGEHHE